MTVPTYNAALYLRLSQEDELTGESSSIITQRQMLRKYADDNRINVYGEYVDDGYSGTNYDRPDFQRMIQDIEDGKVNCVIVKDLSRLGRNYVLTGQYTELYFPSKNVRFIAISDGVDSLNGENEFAPFKNIINEWYARDISKKVRAALQTKYELGQRFCAWAPIGYLKDPDSHGKFIIDEENRWIIEKIFDYALSGMGTGQITKTLTKEKIPTPSWIIYQRNGLFENVFEGQPESKRYAWTIAQVRNILTDETYIGNTIHNKQGTISFKNKKRKRKPESEWVRKENTHKPIISKDVFDRVQDMRKSRRRETKDGQTQIFAGLVKCADCGWTMRMGTNKHNQTTYRHFSCHKYNQYGKDVCTCHYIRYDVLYEYVLSRIRYWSAFANENEDKLLAYLEKNDDKKFKSSQQKANSDIKKSEKRLKELDNQLAKIYEDRLKGTLNERNFNKLTAKCQQEQDELIELVKTLSTKLQEAKEDVSNRKKWIELIKQYTDPQELTAPLLNALIEKIVIHEAVKTENGKEQEVEIFYRFIGKID